jgi:hypothetical protein
MVLWRRKDGSMGGTSYAGSPASSDMWNGLARYRYVAAGYCVVHMIVKAPDISETLAQIYADDLIRGGALWRFVDMRSRRDEDV